MKEASIESPTTMSHVERYHAPLRSVYLKIRGSLRRSELDNDCLTMAVKAVKDTIGPEGLCPTILVFGAKPRMGKRMPAETQIQRAAAIQQGREAATKAIAK